MKKIESQDNNTFFEHKALDKTAYPNDFIDFLGGYEALNKIDIYGHRIIFCIFEMLKSIQIFSPKYNELKAILHDELTIDVEKGKITSIREIQDNEILTRKKLEIGKQLAIIEEKYFAGNFNMLQFIIPTKALNNYGAIVVNSNKVYYKQLEILKTIGKHPVYSNNSKEMMMSSFLKDAVYDTGGSYIRLYITEETARVLINNSNGYADIYRSIVFDNSSVLPLNFYLFLKRKFGKLMSGQITIQKLVESISLPNYCLRPSKMKALLENIQRILKETNNISYGYKIVENNIHFKLYETNKVIGVNLNVTSDLYKSRNALAYIKKVRKINKTQYKMVSKIFLSNGYQKMKVVTTKQLSKEIKGDEYYKWFISMCIQKNLMENLKD